MTLASTPTLLIRDAATIAKVTPTQVRNWVNSAKFDYALESVPNPTPNNHRPTLLGWLGEAAVKRTCEQLLELSAKYHLDQEEARRNRVALAQARGIIPTTPVPRSPPITAPKPLPPVDIDPVSAVLAAMYEAQVIQLKAEVQRLTQALNASEHQRHLLRTGSREATTEVDTNRRPH